MIRVRDLLDAPWPDGPEWPAGKLGDIFTSEKCVALLLRWHVNQPGGVLTGVGNIQARTIGGAFKRAKEIAGTHVDNKDAFEVALSIALLEKSFEIMSSGNRWTMRRVFSWPAWSGKQSGYTLDVPLGTPTDLLTVNTSTANDIKEISWLWKQSLQSSRADILTNLISLVSI